MRTDPMTILLAGGVAWLLLSEQGQALLAKALPTVSATTPDMLAKNGQPKTPTAAAWPSTIKATLVSSEGVAYTVTVPAPKRGQSRQAYELELAGMQAANAFPSGPGDANYISIAGQAFDHLRSLGLAA